VTDALLAAGCEVDQATVRRSVLFAHVKVAEHSDVSNAVVLPHAVIGRNCVLSDVIVTSGVRIPDGIIITRSRHSAAGAAPTLVSADKNGTPLCLGPANATRGRQSVAIHPRRYDHAKATISGRQ
jgi:ADP-glucose pyrophosphorylase